MTSSDKTALPTVGCLACFSAHSTKPAWLGKLPDDDPWTHQAAAPAAKTALIEDTITED
jgi:hypothetical protein